MPANTQRLIESIAQDKAGKTTVKQLALDAKKPAARYVKKGVAKKKHQKKNKQR